ncbi:MAG: hypothetical protein ACRD06_08580, partial [Terriglobia bacterium]
LHHALLRRVATVNRFVIDRGVLGLVPAQKPTVRKVLTVATRFFCKGEAYGQQQDDLSWIATLSVTKMS